MTIFGFNTSDPAGLQNALKAAETNIEQIRSVMQESENRIEGIIRSNFDGMTLTLKLPPVPKATAVEPTTDA